MPIPLHQLGEQITPLMLAAHFEHADVVDFLLKHGANPDLIS
jgi:ankyrin repeat protein